jgi:putative hydrolases of HD superfamily
MQNIANIDKIFEFLKIAGNLKTTYRFSSIKQIKGDSSADHSWRLALMVFLFADELDLKIDVLHAVKIALVHDLPEAITGDIDNYLQYTNQVSKEEKNNGEVKAINELKSILSERVGEEIYSLWKKYEDGATEESKFVKALDKIEAILQNIKYGKAGINIPDMIALHTRKSVKNFPALIPVNDRLLAEVKKYFDEYGIEWKKEYDF